MGARRHFSVIFAACLLALPAACSSSSETPKDSQPPEADGAPPREGGSADHLAPDAPVLDWKPCPGGEGAWKGAECASFERPFLSSAPAGKKLGVLVKRRKAVTQPRKGQLWVIEGGPGPTAGAYLEPQIVPLLDRFPDLDVLTVDHRGTGYSTLLECPTYAGKQADNVAACLKEAGSAWDEKLSGFSTSEAARDLGELIEATRAPGEKVVIYARSYGTYVLNRYLQLYPTQASGVVLDSFCTPEHCISLTYDEDGNAVAKTFFAGCAADATCKGKLGDDPWGTLGALITKLDGTHCPKLTAAGLDSIMLRMALASLFKGRALYATIMPFVYRLDRCTTEDVTAIANFLNKYVPGAAVTSANPERKASWLLERHISFSELPQDTVPSSAALTQSFFSQYVSDGYAVNYTLFPGWPRYPRDPATRQWASSKTPILVLQGELDPATPHKYAAETSQHFTASDQTFVSFPRTGHVTLLDTPLADGKQCALELVVKFIGDPTAKLDTSCASQVLPIDYAAATIDAKKVFGTDTAW